MPVTVLSTPRIDGAVGAGAEGVEGTGSLGTLGAFTFGRAGGGGTGGFGTTGTGTGSGGGGGSLGTVGSPELVAVPDQTAKSAVTASVSPTAFVFHRRCPDRIWCDNRFRARRGSLEIATVTQTARTDYYEVLGVPRTADEEAIKHAFRALARELHPDVSTDPDAEEKFREASEAYGVLSKPATKLMYDRFGFRGRGNGWFGPPGRGSSGTFPEDLLERVFHPGRRRRGEAVAEIQLDSYEAERGLTRTVEFTARETCAACGGDGGAPGALRSTCPACGGSGRRTERSNLDEARLLQIETCAHCSGRGQLVSDPCGRCEGSGRTQVARKSSSGFLPACRTATGSSWTAAPGAAFFAVVRIRRFRHDSLLIRGAALLGFAAAAAFLVYLLFFA